MPAAVGNVEAGAAQATGLPLALVLVLAAQAVWGGLKAGGTADQDEKGAIEGEKIGVSVLLCFSFFRVWGALDSTEIGTEKRNSSGKNQKEERERERERESLWTLCNNQHTR